MPTVSTRSRDRSFRARAGRHAADCEKLAPRDANSSSSCAATVTGTLSASGEPPQAGPTPVCKRRETTTVENEKRHSCTRGDVLAPRRKSSWFAYGWLSLLWLELRLPSDNFLSVETLHFKGECILLGRVHKDDSTHKHRTWIRNFDMVSRAKNTSHTV
jgi:hypothetical protein